MQSKTTKQKQPIDPERFKSFLATWRQPEPVLVADREEEQRSRAFLDGRLAQKRDPQMDFAI